MFDSKMSAFTCSAGVLYSVEKIHLDYCANAANEVAVKIATPFFMSNYLLTKQSVYDIMNTHIERNVLYGA